MVDIQKRIAMFMSHVNSPLKRYPDLRDTHFFVSNMSKLSDHKYLIHYGSSDENVTAMASVPEKESEKELASIAILKRDGKGIIKVSFDFQSGVNHDDYGMSQLGVYVHNIYKIMNDLCPTMEEDRLLDYISNHKSPLKIHVLDKHNLSLAHLSDYTYVVMPFLVCDDTYLGNYQWATPPIFDTRRPASYTEMAIINPKVKLRIPAVVLTSYLVADKDPIDLNAYSVLAEFPGIEQYGRTAQINALAYVPLIRVQTRGQSNAEIILQAYKILFKTEYAYKKKITVISPLGKKHFLDLRYHFLPF